MIWHVAYTAPRAERLAERELTERGYETLCLHSHEEARHANRTYEVLRPRFPNYIFIGRSENRGLMDANTCPGVAHVIRFGEHAEEVPDALISHWRNNLPDPVSDPDGRPCRVSGCLGRPGQKSQRSSRFAPGTRVRIVDGPLAGEGQMQVDGTVQLDEGHMVHLLIEMFRVGVTVRCEPQWLRRLNPTCGAMEIAAS